MAKWKQSGVARLSTSKKVVNLGIYEKGSVTWLIVDVESLFKLIEGKVLTIPIMEVERTSS